MIRLLIFIITVANCCVLLMGAFCLISFLIPQINRGVRIFASVLATLAAISFIYYLGLVLYQPFYAVLIFLTIINLVQLRRSYSFIKTYFNSINPKHITTDKIIVSGAVLLMTLFFFFHASKYGDYDAWALWNAHARYLFYPAYWKREFDSINATLMSHADYPLMLPSLVAFSWKTVGSITFVTPLLLSFFILAASPLLVFSALRANGANANYACLGLLILVADSSYQAFDGAQCPDTLLSLFILTILVLYSQFKSQPGNMPYVLGFLGASCTWIKNEGILFYLVFALVFVFTNRTNLKHLAKFAAASVIPLLVIVSFKIYYAPANDLFDANSKHLPHIIADLKNLSRYQLILKNFVSVTFEKFWIGFVLLSATLFFNFKILKSPGFIIINLLIAGYIFIYLTTPYDLQWHLGSSLNRLLYHVYPSVVYLCLLSFREMGLAKRLRLPAVENL